MAAAWEERPLAPPMIAGLFHRSTRLTVPADH
jgi:hypothetical protein